MVDFVRIVFDDAVCANELFGLDIVAVVTDVDDGDGLVKQFELFVRFVDE